MFRKPFFKSILIAIGTFILVGSQASDSSMPGFPSYAREIVCIDRYILDQYGEDAWQEGSDGTRGIQFLGNYFNAWREYDPYC